jgi:YHS domain-containing protein
MNSNTVVQDIVCGMEINSDDISLDYQGRHYAFCSNQCLERFQSNPHLYLGYPDSEAPKHAGMEVIKKRTLKLDEPLPQEIADKVIDYIEAMMGIQYVEIDGDCIEITYDLLQATEAQIEAAITEAGAVLGDVWMERLKRAFVHYMEETEAVTLEARPGSMRGHHH